MLSLRYIQSLKNIYLQMNGQNPIFEIYDTAEAMVSDQFNTMKIIYKSGIPAIRPYGFHSLPGSRWLLVMEYLDDKTVVHAPEVQPELIDTASII